MTWGGFIFYILSLVVWSISSAMAFDRASKADKAGKNEWASDAFWLGVACAFLALHNIKPILVAVSQ